MILPTMEQLEKEFDKFHHVEEQILIEKQWYWYGITAYIRLLNDIAHEDWLKCKEEMQQDINGFVEMQSGERD